jgi:diguanylate cyclase (GGDEF)-like protein
MATPRRPGLEGSIQHPERDLREADIRARFGGDEFVVLAVEASVDSADALANRMQADLDDRNLRGDRPYQLSVSMGLRASILRLLHRK